MTLIVQSRADVQSRVWFATGAAVFAVLALLGVAMRLTQSGSTIGLSDQTFYSAMTLHGLGMAGVLYVGSLAALWRLLADEGVQVSRRLLWASFALVLCGVVGLVVATLMGKFAPGWYMLYPLVFVNATWEPWASGLGLGSVLALGVAWLLVQCALLWGIFRTFGVVRAFGWQHIIESDPAVKTPPLVLISTVSLVDGIIATLFGAVFLALNLAQWFVPSLTLDPLLMKNIVFIFGHTLVNVGMYMAVGAYYAISPLYSGRPWGTNRVVAIAWNAVLFIVLAAYTHHVYMDFVQPHGLHYLGQIASYATMIPLLAVTAIGGVGQVHWAGMRQWRFVQMAFSWGLVWWIVGGVAAVVDAAIPFNSVYHNTLWVPAHFHTYALMGYVFFLIGTAWHLFGSVAAEWLAKIALYTMIAGGATLVGSFYAGGWLGVPRRYALYDAIPMEWTSWAQALAGLGFIGGAVFVTGFLTLLFAFVYPLFRRVRA